jgi:formylglycine-generating enzyme required for sulfatase activity
MKCLVIAAAAIIVLANSMAVRGESSASVQLEGRVVVSAERAPVVGAQVVLYDLKNLQRLAILTTDEKGKISLPLNSPAFRLRSSALRQNFPNPFNPSTAIPYELAGVAPVRLELFNLLGQRIRTLVDGVRPAGSHQAIWDGRDEKGRGVAAGVYIYRLTVAGTSETRKMVLTDGQHYGSPATYRPPTPQGDSDVPSATPESRLFGLVISRPGLETFVDPEVGIGTHGETLIFEMERRTSGFRSKPAAGTGLLGDVNNDGIVNVIDALIIATYEINPEIALPNDGHIALGDVNEDGTVNIVDALMVATYGINPGNPSLPTAIGSEVETPNRPPLFASVDNQAIAAGVELVIELSAEDPDGDPMAFSMSDAPEGASLEGTRFTWIPTADQVGSFPVTFVAEDGMGGSAAEMVSLYTPELVAELPNGESMEFVWIEPGTYIMGSPPDEPVRDGDEGPQHEVTISRGFYLAKYELTQGQWIAVMGDRPWAGMAHVRKDARRPAVHIKWVEAGYFTHKLNEFAEDKLYRLPTEAEWEYAGRAGTTTRWSFGEDESRLGEHAWYVESAWNVGFEYAQPVGLKRPNPWGLYDMHGNVGEWVSDLYAKYSNLPQVDPTGGVSVDHMMRGGSYASYPFATRSASRSVKGFPAVGRPTIGTRILRRR